MNPRAPLLNLLRVELIIGNEIGALYAYNIFQPRNNNTYRPCLLSMPAVFREANGVFCSHCFFLLFFGFFLVNGHIFKDSKPNTFGDFICYASFLLESCVSISFSLKSRVFFVCAFEIVRLNVLSVCRS